jgi:hypothetical protein
LGKTTSGLAVLRPMSLSVLLDGVIAPGIAQYDAIFKAGW